MAGSVDSRKLVRITISERLSVWKQFLAVISS
jgi:hypothetical protein